MVCSPGAGPFVDVRVNPVEAGVHIRLLVRLDGELVA